MKNEEKKVDKKNPVRRRMVDQLKFIVAGLVMLLLGIVAANKLTVIPERRICFNQEACVWVRVADADGEKARGLSGKLWMHEDVGMIFEMGEADYYSFWMKEMKMGLDFVWLRDGEVVDVTEKVARPKEKRDELVIYRPVVPADSVLEVNEGWLKKHEVAAGDQIMVK